MLWPPGHVPALGGTQGPSLQRSQGPQGLQARAEQAQQAGVLMVGARACRALRAGWQTVPARPPSACRASRARKRRVHATAGRRHAPHPRFRAYIWNFAAGCGPHARRRLASQSPWRALAEASLNNALFTCLPAAACRLPHVSLLLCPAAPRSAAAPALSFFQPGVQQFGPCSFVRHHAPPDLLHSCSSRAGQRRVPPASQHGRARSNSAYLRAKPFRLLTDVCLRRRVSGSGARRSWLRTPSLSRCAHMHRWCRVRTWDSGVRALQAAAH